MNGPNWNFEKYLPKLNEAYNPPELKVTEKGVIWIAKNPPAPKPIDYIKV